VAVHESFNSYVAQVAEISLTKAGGAKVERVVCAVDCGVAVNPDVIRAQMEGGVGFGLGAALRDAITLTGGAVDQANFDSYLPLRMSDMPKVEVHIVAAAESPTGVGEPGVPPTAPAVANAVFKATGKRILELPLRLDEIGRA
jgi:isoquinoline 1-oxidoreductase subunit beta